MGGCCGTTPEHIRLLGQELNRFEALSTEEKAIHSILPAPGTLPCTVSGRASSLSLEGEVIVIGERLNPTGKKRMKEALRQNDMDYLLREAITQAQAGADVLDVNVGLPEIDEVTMLRRATQASNT